MAKPSMFSRNYEKQMRRRKINIILTILIIISAAYFGGKYYIDKNNLNITLFKGKKTADNTPKDSKKAEPQKEKPQEQQPQQAEQPKDSQPPAENKASVIEYKSPDGRIYNIEVISNGVAKEISGLKEESGTVKYDISSDKQSIAFEDKSLNDIIIGKTDGSFTKISRDSYKTVSTKKVLSKEGILKTYPNFIWAQKPKFTSDGRVVYISDLPYIKNDNDLYIWTVNIDGSNHKRVGEFTGNIDSVSYDGTAEDNSLKIKINNQSYVLPQGSYKVEQR